MYLVSGRFEHESALRITNDRIVIESNLGDGPLMLRDAIVRNGQEAVDVVREDECM